MTLPRKALQFSHSKLNDFVTCPYRYYIKYLSGRTIPFEESDATMWGSAVHLMFENRLRYPNAAWDDELSATVVERGVAAYAKDKRVALPDARAHLKKVAAVWQDRYEKWAQLVFKMGGKRYLEMQIAINSKLRKGDDGKLCFEDTEWFGKDVFVRAIADVFVKLDPDANGVVNGVMVDWKTGKLYDNRGNDKHKPDQAALTALVAFAAWPSVQRIDTLFIYTDTPKGAEYRRDSFLRGDIEHMLQYAKTPMAGIIQCGKNDDWPKQRSGLCNGWCPVTDCEFFREKRQ